MSKASALAAIGDNVFSNPIKIPTRESGPKDFRSPRNSEGSSRVLGLIQQAAEKRKNRNAAAQAAAPLSTAEELDRYSKSLALSKHIVRRWKAGDVYAPHDLTPVEMEKWKRRGRPRIDALDVLDLNPLDEYKVRSSPLDTSPYDMHMPSSLITSLYEHCLIYVFAGRTSR